ncbi:SOS-response cell division inhibitor [Idiomarina xiamenensis]|uniref:SOS-response cell division inhibitor n=1 Tax=Idiomarina xiamenensis 10-D-4 TaxID=740709 RepID=K2K4H0_9GAMM|nr:SOS-response cell division inhibitor [Idiomarina xiamenensis]EKE81502.1 SOS-response cell division inhibitor [Idiomarina xiamenensis 10-D-4]
MTMPSYSKTRHPGLWQAAPSPLATAPLTEQWSLMHQADEFEHLVQQVVHLAAKSQKWVTVVGASRQLLERLVMAGVNRNRIRWIHARDEEQREWATEQAILSGTSGIVVGWLSALTPRSQRRLQMASRVSQTVSFLFTPDTLQPAIH